MSKKGVIHIQMKFYQFQGLIVQVIIHIAKLLFARFRGNGIEIYADRPRDQWGEGPGGSTPLDLKELATLVDYEFDGLPANTVVGHVHLRIADVEKSHEFYVETVGFEVQQREEDCLFISAGDIIIILVQIRGTE